MRFFLLKRFCRQYVLAILIIGTLFTVRANAQGVVSGTVSGMVADPTGAAVPQAVVRLINEDTKDSRELQTAADGSFSFAGVFPGVYTLQVAATGFKQLAKTNLTLTPSERLAIGQLVLEVGDTKESVTVNAQGAAVEFASQERSQLLTSTQVHELMNLGRMYMGMLYVLPGMTPSGDTGGLPNVNGLRGNSITLTSDGTHEQELGNPTASDTRSNIDSIAETKILTSNYQAEYGGNGGAIIQTVTKSGTNQFHGAAYWYLQNTLLNANDFFNNRNSVKRPTTSYNIPGYTIGGPVYWPGKFNSDKSKLFFFWTQEDRFRTVASTSGANLGNLNSGLYTLTVPTDMQIAGNFSQTMDLSGKLVPIKDSLNGGAQFPGNIIPASRINKTGQNLLSIFPAPNFFNQSVSLGAYNFTDFRAYHDTRHEWILRTDYNLSSKIRIYFRALDDMIWEKDFYYEFVKNFQNYSLPGLDTFPRKEAVVNTTQIISPTLVNEFLVSTHHRLEGRGFADNSDAKAFSRSALGFNMPQLYPGNNPLNLIPAMSFSDVPNSVGLPGVIGANDSWQGQFPRNNYDLTLTFADGLTKVWRKHIVKAGIDVNSLHRMGAGDGFGMGSLAFGRDVNNPNDANYGYANALLGNFSSYQESSSLPNERAKALIVEWYVQDNWKVTPKLTLDYGIRFSWYSPYTQTGNTASNFALERWNRSNAPVLFQPAINTSGQRVAINPLTGQFAPAPEIGAEVPGSGNPANGMVIEGDSAYPRSFLKNQGVLFGPRFGIAYDVFGDGKTAIRTGVGAFHQTSFSTGDSVYQMNPPFQYNSTVYYGSLANNSLGSGVVFPSSVYGYAPEGQTPTVYSYSFGIQRDVGLHTILDVAYVGNQSRHLVTTTNLNLLPYGTRFLPQNQDPTKPGSPLPDSFLAPYPGYGNILYTSRDGTANYNSLQLQANRRFSSSVNFGFSWTWSRAMGYANSDSSTTSSQIGFPTYMPRRYWSYRPLSFSFTNMAVVNMTWDVPKGSKLWNNVLTRAVLDNWRLSDVTDFESGAPLTISFNTVSGTDLTGGGDGNRISVVSSPYLPKGQRTFARFFNPSAFALPPKGTVGNMGQGLLCGPGINNFNMALAKNFSALGEKLHFQLLFEGYNAFNHTQFSGVNTTGLFDANGNQVSPTFGQITTSRAPRNSQVSLRVTF